MHDSMIGWFGSLVVRASDL